MNGVGAEKNWGTLSRNPSAAAHPVLVGAARRGGVRWVQRVAGAVGPAGDPPPPCLGRAIWVWAQAGLGMGGAYRCPLMVRV